MNPMFQILLKFCRFLKPSCNLLLLIVTDLAKNQERKTKKKTENSSAGNQIILHEETNITEIDETSFADKRTNLSQ